MNFLRPTSRRCPWWPARARSTRRKRDAGTLAARIYLTAPFAFLAIPLLLGAIFTAQAQTASEPPRLFHPSLGPRSPEIQRLPMVVQAAYEQAEAESVVTIAELLGEDGLLPLEPEELGLCDCCYEWSALARAYYVNDHRIEWTGLETTFGAEGQIAGTIVREYDGWETAIEGDFYLNQPFDDNILVDTAERRSYRANFDVDPFEISNLVLSARRGDWFFALGKMETPFGRRYGPLLSNARFDAPFIRTEAIRWRETGLLVSHRRDRWVFDAALVNGSEDLDTNSSKGLIARAGLGEDDWAIGASVKTQDGIGSEWQKVFNSHVGADVMIRRGCWQISGEAIYDEYGTRRAGFDPINSTWGRSIYLRDLNYRHLVPITGFGYYIDVAYQADRWYASLNYGEFHPQQIGNVIHDQISRRGIVKIIYDLTPAFQVYAVTMVENEGFPAQQNRSRKGSVVLVGFQALF